MKKFFRKFDWNSNFIKGAAVIVFFGVIGSVLLVSSHAATPASSVEAEAGTVSAAASKLNDTTASNGQAVKFGHGSTGGACRSSTPNTPDGPDPWGGCFPGPLSTGVPVGTTLTRVPQDITSGPGWVWVVSDQIILVTGDNTILSNLNVTGGVYNRAANVTLKNSKVSDGVTSSPETNSSWSLTIQDSEINGGPHDLGAVGIGNIKVYRSKLFGGHNGLQCDEFSLFCVIQDSYVYGQYQYDNNDTHLGGILSDGTKNFTITHNSVFCDAPVNNVGGGCTGDVNLIPNFSAINGATITYNLMGANKDASYCTYGGEKPPSPTPHSYNIVYQHNIFQKGVTGHCDAFGPVADFNPTNTGNVWFDNKYNDGTLISCVTATDCM
jgi:hypothetical protein